MPRISVAQIKTEGFQQSAVMDTLSWLSDVHGPRLTGTPALRRAGEWAINSRWSLTKHFGEMKTMALEPEHAKLAAYFNLDSGSVRTIFDAWLRPFNYLGASTLTTLNTGGADHMPFDALGLPKKRSSW